MERALRVLVQRDPSRDRDEQQVPLEGYAVYWPDGRRLSVGFDAFCKHGQRLLGLGKHLNGCLEKLVDVLCFPLARREDGLTRLPGHRVRRFCLSRSGRQGRLHFLDGTPTAIVFDLDRDDPLVLDWIGLPALREGESHWLDLAARDAGQGGSPGCDEPLLLPAAYDALTKPGDPAVLEKVLIELRTQR